MKAVRVGWTVALIAALVLVGLAAPARAGETKKMGVVNVSRVFQAYTKVSEVQKKMEVQFKGDRDAIETEGRRLKEWEDNLKADPRPDENRKKFEDLQKFQMTKFDLELKFKELYKRVEEKRKEEMKAVLDEIKGAIKHVGTTQQFDMIMRAPEFDDDQTPDPANPTPEARTAAELVRKFRENPVLFFSQGIDITDQVIKKLNDDYAAKAKLP